MTGEKRWRIGDDDVTAVIDAHGAELVSLTGRDGHEYLKTDDDGPWKRRSPILFPVIGGLPDNRYTVDGEEYRMGSHGFAMHMAFVEAEATPHSVALRLTDSPETREQYPFPFELTVTHAVTGASLRVSYDVVNHGPQVLPFSIGGHPGFVCPMESGRGFEEYRLTFDRRERLRRRIKRDGLLTGETLPCLDDADTLPLSHDLFDAGPVILDGLLSTKVTLGRPGGRSVMMEFPGFTHFGVWQPAGIEPQYVCLEPWFGVDSTKGGPADLREKEGVIHLAPGERFSAAFRITVSGPV